ncbi:MAG: hypothetical protein V4719_04565 [Planctomycetota bacterium]
MVIKQGFWNWFLGSDSTLPQTTSLERGYSHSTPNTIYLDYLFERSLPLSEAVENFNSRAAQNEVGKSQTPLTVDEVATAIRSAGRHQLPLIEHQRRLIHAVAETQQLPAYSGLKFTTTWFAPSGYRCEVWWVDLVLCSPEQPQEERLAGACSLRIRDHRLRSWRDSSVTVPREIQRLQADQRWFTPQPAQSDQPCQHASDELLDRMLNM